MFLQLLINGLIAGAIYTLIASGFSLIYFTCRFVNFAHGEKYILEEDDNKINIIKF